jgi:hypothetical protein
LRWNGQAWAELDWPNQTIQEQLSGVWTDGPNHGYVGGAGKVFEIAGTTITPHDFGNHQLVETFGGTASNLYAGGGSTFLFEDFVEPPYGFLVHFDGSAWTELESGSSYSINAIAVCADGSTWLESNGLMSRQ